LPTTAAGEGTPAREAAEGGSATASGHAETAAEVSSEKVLGVNLESGGMVVGVVVVSIVLAGLVLARRFRLVLWIAGGFCAMAAAGDVAELARQVDRSKNGLAVIARTVAATVATMPWNANRSSQAASTAARTKGTCSGRQPAMTALTATFSRVARP
jgi:hypothetical protein